MVRNEASFISRFKYDILVFVLLALVGVGAWLNASPFTFDSENEEAGGVLPPDMGHGEALLLLPSSTVESDEFEEMDFSFAWYNAMAQEIGPFSVRLTDELAPEDLDGIRLIVVPSKAGEELESPQIGAIETFIEAGGSLIIEMPGPSWSTLTGVGEPVLVGRSTKRITAATGSSLQGDFNQHLLDVPLASKMLRYDTVDLSNIKRNDLLLEIDGVPAHFHRAVGKGHVYVVGFDFGMAVTAIQQGLPEDDFTLPVHPDQEDEDDEYTSPDVMVSSARLRQTSIPYADLLERHMFYSVSRDRPAPSLWLYPGKLLGTVVMTHEERGFGDKAGYMAEYESMLGASSTYFITADTITNDGLDNLATNDAEIGVAWHRSPINPLYASGGIGRLRPYQTELTLAEQIEKLEGWAGLRVTSVRVHEHVWDRHYTTTFRKLNAAGLHIDSSYGPTSIEEFGYLFGTGLPFYPIDTDGLPLPVAEMPFVISDAAGFGPGDDDVATRLIKESRSGFHQVVTFDIDADSMAHNPDPQTLDTWMTALDTAKAENHWVTSLREYMGFYNARRQATLRSSFAAETRLLTVSADIPVVKSARDGSPMPAPAIAIPLRYMGNTLETVILDGQTLENNTLGRTGDGVQALIPVPSGRHTLEIQYGSSQ